LILPIICKKWQIGTRAQKCAVVKSWDVSANLRPHNTYIKSIVLHKKKPFLLKEVQNRTAKDGDFASLITVFSQN
jgi:hypothetical protein